ncbi:ABC transporter permease [Kitasatospora viridis]|uniref:ABC-2 type transport system permease protein n=1 Tax=Kitasatospora viridis TaxID=281105 RepID=A0A561TSU0_9ACTN|nr:ABC transporter permease [Kitasatospora viridis]TWF90179.1 ABC-2 type transport system permease protein [Kitasatospora viridis]
MTYLKYLMAARLSFTEHLAANPWRITVTALWPRALLQCLFWVLIGRVSGAGARFAFPGALALIITLSTVIGVSDVPMLDRRSGTYYRVRMARVSIAGLYAARCAPWIADAVVTFLLCVALVGPAAGVGSMSLDLLRCLPVYLVMILSSTAAGLAVASLGTRFNSNVLLGNSLAYLMLAAGSLIVSAGRVPFLRWVGDVLPMTHGVAAVRAFADGRPWAGQLGWELLVGLGWAAAAALSYTVQAARVRRTGNEFGI